LTLTPTGWQLLKTWEGCRLSAYPDPASGAEPWTIGYGHTGPEVSPGLTIKQAEADAWLEADVAVAEVAVDRLLKPVALSPRQRDALVSFCFNVGAGALEGSTLRRRLLAGEPVQRVIAAELPRWCQGPNGPLEGLQRRRTAEVEHAGTGIASHAASPAKASAPDGLIQLAVPYLSQNDSTTGQGPRMCFSSTCAMAAAFLCPGCLGNGVWQLDDRYLQLVNRHGDSTEATAQVAALADLQIKARLRTDGTIEHLVAQLQQGQPVPVGWLHKGPVSAPTGGGHWSLVIGWDPANRQLLMHDPNGEADLVGGGYVRTAIGSGQVQRYSERNWGSRWMVEGPGSGWWLELGAQS
jgi:GH24 family phage-related lysozyme (muramidase)